MQADAGRLIPAEAHLHSDSNMEADAQWRACVATVTAVVQELEDARQRLQDAERRWQELVQSIDLPSSTQGRPSRFEQVLVDLAGMDARGETAGMKFAALCQALHENDVGRCGGNLNAAMAPGTIMNQLRKIRKSTG